MVPIFYALQNKWQIITGFKSESEHIRILYKIREPDPRKSGNQDPDNPKKFVGIYNAGYLDLKGIPVHGGKVTDRFRTFNSKVLVIGTFTYFSHLKEIRINIFICH